MGDAVGMGGAATNNPKNSVVGIDENELPLLIDKREVMVAEIVADQLTPSAHPEGLKIVGGKPVAERKRPSECVGVEEECVTSPLLKVGRKVGYGMLLDMKVGHGVCCRMIRGRDDNPRAMGADSLVCG